MLLFFANTCAPAIIVMFVVAIIVISVITISFIFIVVIIIIIIKVLVLSSHHRYPWQFFNCNGPFNSLNYMGTDHGPSVWILLGVGNLPFQVFRSWNMNCDYYGRNRSLWEVLQPLRGKNKKSLDLMHDLGHLNSWCFFFPGFIRIFF